MNNFHEQELPLVSCITTTFNNFKYFFLTLDSIFMQDYPNLELVISDDGSESFPEESIRSYIEAHKKDNIKKVVFNFHKENYGTVKNSNLNRSLASGEYYIGIGADDLLHDDRVVSDIVRFFEKTGAKIITCRRQFMSEDGKQYMACMPFKDEVRDFRKLTPQEQFKRISSFNYISGASTYLRASFFKEIGGLDEEYKYFEDYPLYLKLLRNGQRIVFFDRISIYYRFGSGQSTASKKNNPYKIAIYNERIKTVEKDIIPYYDNMEWWRKKHINTKLISYKLERDNMFNSDIKKYLFLMKRSIVGTVIQIYYQVYYKLSLKHNVPKQN